MRIFTTIGLGLSLLIPGVAAAAPFNPIQDFRDSMFEAGEGHSSHLFHMDGYDILFETLAFDGGGFSSSGRLYWSGDDGFGIRGEGYESDEIEGPEVLRVSFSHMAIVDRVLVTDLFVEHGYPEQGYFSADGGGTWTSFYATGAHSNGAVEVAVNQQTDSLLFAAPGYQNGGKHEFSVAGVDAHWAKEGMQGAVPEPGAALLFSAGFLLMRARSRRMILA